MTSVIFAHAQGLVTAMWLVVLVVVLTLGSLGAGIGLCLGRAHRKLGHQHSERSRLRQLANDASRFVAHSTCSSSHGFSILVYQQETTT